MHTDYQNPTLRQLRDQQVRYAPRDKKLEQAARAEQLLTELDPERVYTYEYLCFRITDFRPEATPNPRMSGEQARHDLRLFVEDVSDSADVRVEDAGERVHTVEELSKLFNVSTKTISRWRQQGLVSRRFIVDGRKRVGFLHSSVERFVSRNRDRVARGERFSQLNDRERSDIIERAMRMARAGGTLAEVTRRIAKDMNRSVETIRYTLKQHDKRNPGQAIFPDLSGPLTEEAKQRIYELHRQGTPVAELARRFQRGRGRIHSILTEMRAKRILELPLDYIPNDCFEDESQESEFLGDTPSADFHAARVATASGLAVLLGVIVRRAVAESGAGSAPVPQVQLPEAQGFQVARRTDARGRSPCVDEPDRGAVRCGGGREESDRAGEPAPGGVDRQAACHARRGLLHAGQRRQHVADSRGREVRLRSRQQVQHLRHLGDHEELRADHSRRIQASGSIPHQFRRDVRRQRRTCERTSTSRRTPSIFASCRSTRSWTAWTSGSSRSSSAASGSTTSRSR